MAKTKLYIFEDGACRGDSFTNRNIIDRKEAFGIIEKGLKLEKGTDEYEDYMEDNVYCHYDDYDVGVAIGAMINGSDYIGEKKEDILKRFEGLKSGDGVVIELEESTIGIGFSKKDARDACLSVMVEEW